MKKYAILGLIAFVALILSGCGNSSTSTNSTAAKTYATSKSIWKSIDGGSTWEAKNKSKDKLSVASLDVLNIAINPENSQNVLIGLKEGGFIKTENGGDIWQKTNFISERVYGLAFDPFNPKIIYAGGIWEGRGKIFKSEDSGENWKEIFTAAQNGPFVISINIDNKNPRIIYATTSDNQAMKSEDAGGSWKNIYQAKSPILKLAIDKANSNLIYAITLNGQVYRSKDAGTAFENVGKNISVRSAFSVDKNFSFLETDPQNSGWVYLTGKGGIIRSKNSGDSWEKVVALNDPGKTPVTALAINPKNSRELIYGSGQAAYKSIDGGINWTTSQFDTEQSVSIIKYDPTNPELVYIGFKKQ